MRTWTWGLGVVAVLGAAYWSWPLLGAAQFASTVRAGSPADIAAEIDTAGLRRSLSRQIARAYLVVSGKGDKLGSFGRSLAGAAVTTVADPYVAELLTPENIAALLAEGRINQVKLGDRAIVIKTDLPRVSGLLDGKVLSVVTGSYFDGLKDFVIPVETASGSPDQYGIHMHLVGLNWKLSGLDLPPAMVEDMARGLLQGQGQASL